jgi:hypothetical protein
VEQFAIGAMLARVAFVAMAAAYGLTLWSVAQ